MILLHIYLASILSFSCYWLQENHFKLQTEFIGIVINVQALTVRQIYRISTMYWDDKYGTQSVSNEAWLLIQFLYCFVSSVIDALSISERYLAFQVVAQMREILNKDNQNLTSNSFLLDDDLR